MIDYEIFKLKEEVKFLKIENDILKNNSVYVKVDIDFLNENLIDVLNIFIDVKIEVWYLLIILFNINFNLCEIIKML